MGINETSPVSPPPASPPLVGTEPDLPINGGGKSEQQTAAKAFPVPFRAALIFGDGDEPGLSEVSP